MPIPALAAAAAMSILDTGSQAGITATQNKRARNFTREMYGKQRNDALADWNMQNEYNSPAAQMLRLREAGLNPNLVYGNGGSVMQSAVMRSSDMTKEQPIPMTGTRLGEAMRNSYDIQLANAQLTNQQLTAENLRQDLENKKANEVKTYAETGSVLVNTKGSKFDLDRKNELALQIIEDAWASTGLKKAQIDATVHGNQRANELQPFNIKQAGKLNDEKDMEIANKKLQNIKTAMENNQYAQMRPIQLAQAKFQVTQLQAQIANTKQETKNTEQITRLNKMEADLGKAMKMIQTAMGTVNAVKH